MQFKNVWLGTLGVRKHVRENIGRLIKVRKTILRFEVGKIKMLIDRLETDKLNG